MKEENMRQEQEAVSGEPKTLWEMTPREAWEHAWEQAIDTCRVFEEEATAGRLEVVRSIGRQFLDQDAGVRVVARDEAALTYEGQPISAADAQLLLDAYAHTLARAREALGKTKPPLDDLLRRMKESDAE